MTVKETLSEKMRKGTLHMTLLDPAKQDPRAAAEICGIACELGTDAIMVGGSTGVTQENLDRTVQAIKSEGRRPGHLLPIGAHAISPYADAMLHEHAQFPQYEMDDEGRPPEPP